MNYLSKIPCKNPDLAWRQIDNSVVIVFLNSMSGKEEKIDILNTTAMEVWKLIDSKKSVSDIINDILGEYEAKPSRIKVDIHDLLIDMRKKDLIYYKE